MVKTETVQACRVQAGNLQCRQSQPSQSTQKCFQSQTGRSVTALHTVRGQFQKAKQAPPSLAENAQCKSEGRGIVREIPRSQLDPACCSPSQACRRQNANQCVTTNLHLVECGDHRNLTGMARQGRDRQHHPNNKPPTPNSNKCKWNRHLQQTARTAHTGRNEVNREGECPTMSISNCNVMATSKCGARRLGYLQRNHRNRIPTKSTTST
jgi:hypothetical protein